eukprot:scaffold13555_cov38-Cyclotella_meneghiniana.AAC.7
MKQIFSDFNIWTNIMNNPFSDSAQWTQMRQEIMDSLRAELQNNLQSQVDQLKTESSQLKEKVAQLEGGASRGGAEKSELKQRCDTLHHANAMLLKRQLEGEEKISLLEEKLDSLQNSFDRAERKAKYLEVVSKNQQWEYPRAVPTMSELMSDGYSEEQSEEIIRQIDHIVYLTTQMRKGEAIDIVYVSDPCAESYHYYEGILPHYRQFASALIEYQHTIDYMEYDTFQFDMGWEAHLPAQVVPWLQKGLQHTHFDRLEFRNDQIEGVGYINMEFISNCVRDNSRLEKLHLESIAIEHPRDVDLFCEALNNNGSLLEMELRYCGTEGGALRDVFNKLRTKKVYKIDLSRNHLSNLRPTDMSEFLSSNPSLDELYLGNNPFNEQDIVYIADALRHNNTLRSLHFCFRFRDPPTNLYLLEYAIFDSTSLNAAYDSNHHCRLYFDRYDGMTSIDYKFNTYRDPKLNRQKKIYTLLSKRNRRRENAAVFEQNGIGIKHIPQILYLLKPFSEHHLHHHDGTRGEDEVKPLSIAYEIMRDWRMPELYNLDQMEED